MSLRPSAIWLQLFDRFVKVAALGSPTSALRASRSPLLGHARFGPALPAERGPGVLVEGTPGGLVRGVLHWFATEESRSRSNSKMRNEANLPCSQRPSFGVALFQPESSPCSNRIWISATTTCSSMLKPIAAKSIRRSRWRPLRGRKLASSIGGSESISSGSVVYAVRTAGNAGSKLAPVIHDGLECRRC